MADETGTGRRVALVLGSGGVKCAAALGLQDVLRQEGIALDLVVGCSGGSVYALGIALGIDAVTLTEMTKTLWTRDVTSRRRWRAWLEILLPGPFGFDERFGMLDDSLAMRRLRAAFGDATFGDTQVPLYITTTDFKNGEQVVLTEGAVVDALRASFAIPYLFPAHPVGDRLLVDGYLSDPMPVGVAIKEGADLIIAMGFDSPYQSRISSLARFSFQLSSIMANNLLKANFAFHNLAHHSEIIPIIPQFEQRIRLFDTDKISYIIEEGRRAARAQLPYLRRLLADESKAL